MTSRRWSNVPNKYIYIALGHMLRVQDGIYVPLRVDHRVVHKQDIDLTTTVICDDLK